MRYQLVNDEFDEKIALEPNMPEVRIGRGEDNNIVIGIEDYRGTKKLPRRHDAIASVSRHHGIFHQEQINGGLLLSFEDFSRYGSYWSMNHGLNGFKQVKGSVLLYPDYLLRLGNKLVYKLVYGPEADDSELNSKALNLLRATTTSLKETLKRTLGRLV